MGRLFDDAVTQLNQTSLVNFLFELCNASRQQLPSYIRSQLLSDVTDVSSVTSLRNALLLNRLGDVMLRVMRSDRPLLHLMKCWAVVSPHLVEVRQQYNTPQINKVHSHVDLFHHQAACHRDASIAKQAVASIHDTVTWLLSNRLESPFFHFNELLCKSYENLMYLELCDGDVQDQVKKHLAFIRNFLKIINRLDSDCVLHL